MQIKYKYYEIVSSDGIVHFGSYDRTEARFMLHEFRSGRAEAEGHSGFKTLITLTDEKPDAEIYGKDFVPFTTTVTA